MLALCSFPVFATGAADTYHYDNQCEVLGAVRKYTVKNRESLYEVARRYKTGFNKIVAANPGVDPIVPGKGRAIVLPTSWVLPDTDRSTGIVINISEMRLYYFFEKNGSPVVRTYPIGIGDEGYGTPMGTFTVIEKIKHPSWHVPASIRKERPELPEIVPPGPSNPLGSRALRLSRRTVLIHGTDVPWGIGRRVSHGCVRLYPEDIVELYRLVPLRTKVTIIRQPVNVGLRNGRVYVEVNRDPERRGYDYLGEATALLQKKGLLGVVSMDKIAKAVKDKKGFPVDVQMEK